ncbi:MAG: universal stress protein [Burkholderiaceae bacterium]
MVAHADAFSRLLLATEHSEFDAGAQRVALALAARLNLVLPVVLAITGNPEFDAVAPELAERADAAAAEKLQQLRVLAAAQGVQLAIQVRHGPEPYREIVDEARAQNTQVIVIRRRGRVGLLANLLIGEMVGKVIAHAPCSVLVNPRGAQLWKRGIVAAVDPQAPDAAVVDQAATLAVAFGLPLTVLGVGPGTAEDRVQAQPALDAALARAQALGAVVNSERTTGKVHEQIIDAARRLGADLIVLGRHDATRVARAGIGSVAQRVIGLADCPVLLCTPRVGAAHTNQEIA